MTNHTIKTLAEALRRISRIGADDPVSFEEKAARLSAAVGLATEALAKFDAAQQAAGEQALPPLPREQVTGLFADATAAWVRDPDYARAAQAAQPLQPMTLGAKFLHQELAREMADFVTPREARAAQAAQPLPAPAEGEALPDALRVAAEIGRAMP